tara:strand:+ start:6103 stop:6906 length:804 start_codon:yes stop_codon:yes gene_type:complete
MKRSPVRIIRGLRRELAAGFYDWYSRLLPHSQERLIQDSVDVWEHNKDAGATALVSGSHWLNQGGGWTDRVWREYGESHLEMMRDGLTLAGRTSPIRSVVEWGSGGGSNAAAIGPNVDRYFGVDISQSNLDECVRRTEDLGLKNFEPIHIPAPYPEEVLKQIDSVDFFLSTAVYQHLPGRSYARRVTDIAMRLLADDGLALINIRYSNLKRQNRNWRRSYKKHADSFNHYTVWEFQQEMEESGMEIMEIHMQPITRHAYFFLRKSRV